MRRASPPFVLGETEASYLELGGAWEGGPAGQIEVSFHHRLSLEACFSATLPFPCHLRQKAARS